MADTANVVIGANYGDEGKGLMTDYFAAQSEGCVVVRFNGGCQAGHTVTAPDGARHVFSHFGSGSFTGAATYFSRHFAVNPFLFAKEQAVLKPMLQQPLKLYADARAPVTTPFDMLLNQIAEAYRGHKRHGSCGMGFGETIGRQESAFPLCVADLLNADDLEPKVRAIRDYYLPLRCEALGVPLEFAHQEFGSVLTSESLIQGFLHASEDFLTKVAVIPDAQFLATASALVMEGAQGLLLDQKRGAFPHVTRSNTGLTNALDVAQEANIAKLNVTYVTRAYLTRHGAGPLANELMERPYEKVVDLTNQPNRYQGSLRFAYLDHDMLSRAIRLDLHDAIGSTVQCEAALAVSCLDQVGGDAFYWKHGALERRTLEKQLIDLDANVLPLGHLSWGPSRTTIEMAAPARRAAA